MKYKETERERKKEREREREKEREREREREREKERESEKKDKSHRHIERTTLKWRAVYNDQLWKKVACGLLLCVYRIPHNSYTLVAVKA